MRRKKHLLSILFCILLSFTATFLFSETAHASQEYFVSEQTNETLGNLVDTVKGATDFITDPGSSLRNYISDSVIDGSCGKIYDMYAEFITTVIDFVILDFGPDITTFNNYVGGTSIFDIFTSIGYTLAGLIFLYMMIMSVGKAMNVSDSKDTPWKLLIMIAIAWVAITFSKDITDKMFEITRDAWDYLLEVESKTDGSSSEIATSLKNIALPTSLVDAMGFSVDSTIGVLLSGILGVIFFIQYAKFIIEIIERYCVACLLYYVFPTAVATIVSNNTKQIFKKYFQMLCCQLLLLIFNLLFVNILCRMAVLNTTIYTFTGWLSLFAMMKVAQRIDFYMHSMGLNNAITGGALMDSIGMAGRTLTGFARSGQLAAGLGAAALTRLGSSSGNLGMLRAGHTLSEVANPIRSATGMHGLAGSLSDANRMGTIDSISKGIRPDMVDESLVQLAKTRSMNSQMLNNLPMETRKAIFDQAYGTDFLPSDAQISDLHWVKFGDITGTMAQTDENGKVLSTSSFMLTPNATDKALSTIDTGSGTMYFTSRPNIKPGEEIAYQYNPDKPNEITFAECAAGMKFDDLGDIRNDITSIRGGQDGNVQFMTSEVTMNDDGTIMDRQEKPIANLDSHGKWDYNLPDSSISEDEISNISQFKGMEDLCMMKSSTEGSYVVMGTRRDLDNTAHHEEYRLYNRAVYPSKENVPVQQGERYVTGFGKNDQLHGSYHVYHVNVKNDKDGSVNATRHEMMMKNKSKNK